MEAKTKGGDLFGDDQVDTSLAREGQGAFLHDLRLASLGDMLHGHHHTGACSLA